MSLSKSIFFKTTGLIPANFFRGRSSIQLLLPYHHVVSDHYLPHISPLYSFKSKAAFERDLDYLLKNYHPIHPDDLTSQFLSGTPLKDKSFLLTFDDGFKEVYEVIFPILNKKGVPAIFFINPAFINNNELFYRAKLALIIDAVERKNSLINAVQSGFPQSEIHIGNFKSYLLKLTHADQSLVQSIFEKVGLNEPDFLKKERPFLLESEIIQMHKAGFRFGGHSWDHPYFKYLRLSDQLSQTVKSIKYIDELLNPTYRYFSFPHEDKSIRNDFFIELSRTAGGPHLIFGTQNQLQESNFSVFHRFNAERPQFKGEHVIKGQELTYALKKLMGKIDVIRS